MGREEDEVEIHFRHRKFAMPIRHPSGCISDSRIMSSTQGRRQGGETDELS